MLDASPWIRRWTHLIEPHATVLDVACGSGRHLQWFAQLGHPVLGLDRNVEALRTAKAFGQVLACDLESDPWPLGAQRFGAVIVTNYLWRPLLPVLVDALAPGGVLLYETFAAGQETIGKPSNPDFLLRPGELLEACAGLCVVAYENGCLVSPQRFVQRVAAVRTAGDAEETARWVLAPQQLGQPSP